jgi:hypothetical protein
VLYILIPHQFDLDASKSFQVKEIIGKFPEGEEMLFTDNKRIQYI